MPRDDAGAAVPPDPACFRCSKPITPGTASQLFGRPVHMRCLAQDTRLESIEQQDRANRTRARAEALIEHASQLAARARARPWICPACERPLSEGGGLLFQGDVLVHSLCWRAGAEDGRPAPVRVARAHHQETDGRARMLKGQTLRVQAVSLQNVFLEDGAKYVIGPVPEEH